jgi:hypothetical protein
MRPEIEIRYVTERYLGRMNTFSSIGSILFVILFTIFDNWIYMIAIALLYIVYYFIIRIYYSGSLLFVKKQSGIFVTRKLSREDQQALGRVVEVKKTWNYNFKVSEELDYNEQQHSSSSLQVNLELHFEDGHSIIITDDLYPWQEDVNDFEYRYGDTSTFKEELYASGSLRKILRSVPWLT